MSTQIRFDLSEIGSKKVRGRLKASLADLDIDTREDERFWNSFPGTSQKKYRRMLVFADLARIVRRFSAADRHQWVASVRRSHPYFVAVVRTNADRARAAWVSDLARVCDLRIAVYNDSSGQRELRSCLEEAVASLDPTAVLEARYIPESEALWMTFGDGRAGQVAISALGFEEGEVQPETATPSIHRDSIEIARTSGDLLHIDAASLRSLIDPQFAEDLKAQAQREVREVGEHLKSARKRKGLTQKELERKSGIDQAIISRIERGQQQPRFDTLRRFAEGMGISVPELLAS